MKSRTFKVRFSSVYRGVKAPRPVTVTVDARGKSLRESEGDAIVKVAEEYDINDEAFRSHAELVSET